MKRKSLVVFVCFVFLVMSAGAWGAEGEPSLATVDALSGDVQVGREGQWRRLAVGDALAEGEIVKTGPASRATILFDGDLKADVGEGIEITLSDLLLKTRLEKMKSTISEPTDTEKVEMKVPGR